MHIEFVSFHMFSPRHKDGHALCLVQEPCQYQLNDSQSEAVRSALTSCGA